MIVPSVHYVFQSQPAGGFVALLDTIVLEVEVRSCCRSESSGFFSVFTRRTGSNSYPADTLHTSTRS